MRQSRERWRAAGRDEAGEYLRWKTVTAATREDAFLTLCARVCVCVCVCAAAVHVQPHNIYLVIRRSSEHVRAGGFDTFLQRA